MKLLIVEDHAISRSVLERMLRKTGYDVVVAEDAKQAWIVLQQPNAPRVAILDWMMPGMDGVELCEKIRQDFGPHFVYIIMLTCKDRPEDRDRAYAAGADNFIAKPYHIDEVRAHLRAARRILDLQDKVTELESQLCPR